MNWNNARSDDRLSYWRSFRQEIHNRNLDEQLEDVAKYWADAPFGTRTLDFYDPKSWPSAWEILYHGTFCRNSVSLLIYYTLSLVLDPEHTICMLLVDDPTDRYLVPLVNNKYVLNYYLGEVMLLDEINIKTIDVFDEDIKKIT